MPTYINPNPNSVSITLTTPRGRQTVSLYPYAQKGNPYIPHDARFTVDVPEATAQHYVSVGSIAPLVEVGADPVIAAPVQDEAPQTAPQDDLRVEVTEEDEPHEIVLQNREPDTSDTVAVTDEVAARRKMVGQRLAEARRKKKEDAALSQRALQDKVAEDESDEDVDSGDDLVVDVEIPADVAKEETAVIANPAPKRRRFTPRDDD